MHLPNLRLEEYSLDRIVSWRNLGYSISHSISQYLSDICNKLNKINGVYNSSTLKILMSHT